MVRLKALLQCLESLGIVEVAFRAVAINVCVETVPFGMFEIIVDVRLAVVVQGILISIRVGHDEPNRNMTDAVTSRNVGPHVSHKLFQARCIPLRRLSQRHKVVHLVASTEGKGVGVFRKFLDDLFTSNLQVTWITMWRLIACDCACRTRSRCQFDHYIDSGFVEGAHER